MKSVLRFAILVGALCGGLAFADDPQTMPFRPSVASSLYYVDVGTSAGTPFVVPFTNPQSSYPTASIQYRFKNLGSASIYVAWGATSGAVTSVTLPVAGSGTISTAGNARVVEAGKAVTITVVRDSWFNAKSASGTQRLEVEAGLGFPQESAPTAVALAAGSAVVGHVVTDTGSTTAVTGNVNAVQATGTNLHTTTDAGSLSTYSPLQTYSAYVTGYTAYATPTDLVCIAWGSRTVTITNFQILIGSTAAALQDVFFVRRSTLNTGGTPTVQTAVKFLFTNAAATATVTTYASAPSLGSSAGTLWDNVANSGAVATAAPGTLFLGNPYTGFAAGTNMQGVSLAASGEALCANYNGAALTVGFTARIIVTWTEQ